MKIKIAMNNKYAEARPSITKDGSMVRELIHPRLHGNRNLSLAEASVPVGSATLLHLHKRSEEIYYILDGEGVMTLGNERFEVKPGDSILISPETPHQIQNTGKIALRFLCCCAPAYSHDDTKLI